MADNVEEIAGGQWLTADGFMAILQKLFGVTERPDSNESNLCTTAYVGRRYLNPVVLLTTY